jgi:adenine-specific DNA-methyltransferase
MMSKKEAQENKVNIIETDNTLKSAKAERIEKIKELLPNVINSDNQIDLKALNDLVGSENTTSNNQGYELTFAGKGLARAEADRETTKELKAETEQSKNFDETGNVIIRGDNIDSLKILYKNYHNSIKMIYIDPPYNTKSENFIYKDNFKQSDSKLIKEFGLGEDTTNFLDNIYGTRSHSGWLSFMYPRLMLAKELLKDDGVIFISIDDNEQANLKIMCDEIFGEDNFVAQLIWKSGRTASSHFTSEHEYVFVYSKNKNALDFFEYNGSAIISDRTIKKPGIKNPLSTIDFPEGIDFESEDKIFPNSFGESEPVKITQGVFESSGRKLKSPVSIEAAWAMKDMIQKWINGEDIIDQKGQKVKRFFFKSNGVLQYEKEKGTFHPKSIIESYTTKQGSSEVSNLLDNGCFEFPKPTGLLGFFTNAITNLKNEDTILDFFAGSGTTAHAVMQQNAEDGGNRKFILCQLDEAIDPKKSKPAYDFCNDNKFEPVISSITIERVNRAGDKIKAENPDKNIDIGYKVFSHTERPRVDYDAREQKFNIMNQRAKTIDTLINMLVATCKPLDTKIETIKADAIYKADNEIYVVDKITADDLEPFKDLKINIDALADFNLKDYLNIDLAYQDNITMIY